MWTVLLLSVRMALPHYCQGGAVNGRIGAVNDVALTSPKGMATQRQAPASYGTRGTRGCYRTRGSAEEPAALFLGLLLII
jgi:hypothetical protein